MLGHSATLSGCILPLQLAAPACLQHTVSCRLLHPRSLLRAPQFASRQVTRSSAPISLHDESSQAAQIKEKLSQALEGINRGIFGVQASRQASILNLIEDLEQHTTDHEAAQHLKEVEGCWRLLFSTIKIQGVRKTRLGLREVVSLGDFLQIIDTTEATAVNQVLFSLNLFGKLPGKLTIKATYKAVGSQRVEVTFADAKLEPRQLQELFASQLDSGAGSQRKRLLLGALSNTLKSWIVFDTGDVISARARPGTLFDTFHMKGRHES
ncbi:hypothetical protein WJX84_009714 [Apatococcus fuscideae]|uniref:Plastid lipid-associated protein/fibrillin conserved domain-containing protein n=1 Tax=Apatococcus fuscideae TaxID=2026836 RepID=A0AAW1T7H5_9CHLO